MQLCICLPADAKALAVIPRSVTASYAAPEVLRSLQLQCTGACVHRVGINGPSADFWAVGVVLYELLTGELPFTGKCYTAGQEPEYPLPPDLKPEWERYTCMLEGQQSWVRPSSVHMLFPVLGLLLMSVHCKADDVYLAQHLTWRLHYSRIAMLIDGVIAFACLQN